jgi:hypothetical protein
MAEERLEVLLAQLIGLQRQVLENENEGERKIFHRMLDKHLMEVCFKIATSMERRLFFHGSAPLQRTLRCLPDLKAPVYYSHGMPYRNVDKVKDLIHRAQHQLDPNTITPIRLPHHKVFLVDC